MFDIKKYAKKKNNNVSRTVRFPDEIFDEINELSAKNNISVNSFIVACVKYSIENMKK
jgi:predicted HicB family RNase H-like nuclease